METARPSRSLFWDWDLERRVVTWSGPLEELVGWRPDNDRAAWDDHIAADDAGPVQALLDELQRGQRSRGEVRYRVTTRDGHSLAVQDSMVVVEHLGRPQRIVGSIKPLAALGPASLAARLDATERRFRRFIDGMPVLAWEADVDGWVEYYNQPWYAYTGTTFGEMEGWGWVRVHDPLDVPRVLRIARNALASGQAWEGEFRLRRADGALRWHLWRVTPLRDGSGRIVRWIGTNTDTHEQHLALEERERLLQAEQRARRAAEQASSEKDEFLSLVSHELRTPLGTIMTRIETLELHDELPAPVAASARKARHSAQVLANLIDDLLDVSRMISGRLEIEREPVAILEPVRQALDALQEQARAKQVDVRLAGASSATVVGSPARLRQIVGILVDNAIEFSDPSGRVDVAVERDGPAVVITVRDEGRGIAPERLPQLFEGFVQGKLAGRRREGSLGFGLPIAHTLAGLHGGTLAAHSPGPGRGATFMVRLPIADAAAVEPPAEEAATGPVSLTGIRVLGVDDDPESREVLAMALLAYQATVTVAASAADAFEQLRVEVPDVIVSDIAMPEVDGYAFVERLRAAADARVRALPIIALTAYASERDRTEALRRGFSSYVAKPYDGAILARLIAEVMARHVSTSC